MKKITLLFMIVFLVSTFNVFGQTSSWDGTIPAANPDATFGGGDGSEATPYLISSAADLAQLAVNVRDNKYIGKIFKQTVDIDLNGDEVIPEGSLVTYEWCPIGITPLVPTTTSKAGSFEGVFDGNNKTINNLKISVQSSNSGGIGAGLFGNVAGSAVLKNIHIKNVSATANQPNMAGLAGHVVGTVQVKHCSVTDSKTGAGWGPLTSKAAVFIANATGTTIEDCYVANTTFTESGQHQQAAFIGSGSGIKLINCFMSKCDVKYNSGGNNKGIFIGSITNSEITNCYIDYEGEDPLINEGAPLTNVTIKNGETVLITMSEGIRSADDFAAGRVAWELNTNSGTIANTHKWSNDDVCPIYALADGSDAIVKAGLINGKADRILYAKGLAVLSAPTSFSYITIGNEITKGEITGITQPKGSNNLVYVEEGVTVNGWNNNVVAGGVCALLALTDGKALVCPTPFTATKAIYTRDCLTDGSWESIALPFAVTSIKAGDADVTANYTIEGYTEKTDSKITFTPLEAITEWTAGGAYIMKHKTVTIGTQKCVFESGAGVSITADATDADFLGTFAEIEQFDATNYYILNADGTLLNKATDTDLIPAFRAYLKKATVTPAPASYSVVHNGGVVAIDGAQAEGINSIYAADGAIIINTDKAQTIQIYGVDGRRVRTVEAAEGETKINGLAQGIYIANNRKVIIK